MLESVGTGKLGLLAGPRCRAPLVRRDDRLICSAAGCAHACDGFATLGGKPVLIDFERSIVDRRAFFVTGGGNHIDRNAVSRWRTYRMVKRLAGANRDAAENATLLLALLKAGRPRPVVVIMGGATRGLGSDQFWTDPQIELISFDIYDSPNVHFLTDAHYLPLLDESVDGVWVQAVPEHAFDPAVVSEIHRVLRSQALVWVETRFMQQVHEFQHDFFRVSHSVHRWLFHGFDQSRPVGGAGTTLNWSIKHLVWCLAEDGMPHHLPLVCLAAAPRWTWSRRRRLG